MYGSAFVIMLSIFRSAAKLQQPLGDAGNDHTPFDSSFDGLVEKTLRQWHVPGLSIAVVDNGKIASKGYGHAVLPKQLATSDTVYMTGSTTKAFTAAAAAILVHDNENYPQVKWTSPINDFIRGDFVLENDYATNHVTIEDALVHRVGLPRHDLVHGQPNDTVADVVRKLRYLPLTAEPARKYQYCPIMYGVVAHVLQTITGRSLAEQLSEGVWKPLRMLSTTFTMPNDTSQLARGYWWHEAEAKYYPEPYDDLTSITGSGDIFSTVNDYALWMKALLKAAGDDGSAETETSPLSSNLVHDLFTPRVVQDEYQSDYQPILYALGWDTSTVFGEVIMAHGGGETGFGTQAYMLPGKQYGVVTMANTEETGAIAGAVLASHLLLEQLNVSADAFGDSSSLLTQKRSVRRQKQSGASDSCSETPRLNPLPLPRPMADFAGMYSHPAYGTIKITLTKAANSGKEVLEALFYPRTWPQKLQLAHISSTTFGIRFFEPHGLGNIETGEDIAWERVDDDEDDFRAIFEFGRDGKTVERVGMEIEVSLVEMAMELGEREWRKGMIWFEKIY